MVARGLARPDLALFVAHRAMPPERWKPTSAALIARRRPRDRARGREPPRAPPCSRAWPPPAARGKTVVADVTRPLAEWAPDLAAKTLALADAGVAAGGAR